MNRIYRSGDWGTNNEPTVWTGKVYRNNPVDWEAINRQMKPLFILFFSKISVT